MIKISHKNNSERHVELSGSPTELIEDMLTVILSVTNSTVKPEKREKFIESLPELVRLNERTLRHMAMIDLSALNGEEDT